MTDSRIFSSPELKENYEFLTHSSGLRVLIFPKRMTTTYAMLGVCESAGEDVDDIADRRTGRRGDHAHGGGIFGDSLLFGGVEQTFRL